MKAILINPITKTISEVDYDGHYQSIYKLTGCETFTTVSLDGEGETCFVDDEGLLQEEWTDDDGVAHEGQKPFFIIKTPEMVEPYPLCGKGLVLGTDGHGESIATGYTVEALTAMVQWLPDGTHIEPSMSFVAF